MMYTLRLSFIFLIIAVCIGNCEEQYCSIDNTEDCVKEKKLILKLSKVLRIISNFSDQ